MNLSRAWVRIAPILIALSACARDDIVEVLRATAPDGKVVAVYRQYFYGGAAGGQGHCVRIVLPPILDKSDCALLSTRLVNARFAWEGTVLTVFFDYAGYITKFTNHIDVKNGETFIGRYEIRLHPTRADAIEKVDAPVGG